MTKEQMETIIQARTRYESASRNRMGVNAAREQLKTVLFNCSPELISMLKSDEITNKVDADEMSMLRSRIIQLEADIESLHGALAEADAENDELRKELRMSRQGG